MVHDPHRLSDVSSAAWLCFEMDPTEIEKGPHTVKVALAERNPHLSCDLVLTDVELVILFKKP
jgi:hypothetical protein